MFLCIHTSTGFKNETNNIFTCQLELYGRRDQTICTKRSPILQVDTSIIFCRRRKKEQCVKPAGNGTSSHEADAGPDDGPRHEHGDPPREDRRERRRREPDANLGAAPGRRGARRSGLEEAQEVEEQDEAGVRRDDEDRRGSVSPRPVDREYRVRCEENEP